MQRIASVYAKPGMKLARPVHDNWGDIILASNVVIDARDVALIDDIGVGEIFIANDLTDDIVVVPTIPPELEGAMSKALRRVHIECRTMLTGKNKSPVDMMLVNVFMDEIVDKIMGSETCDHSIAGCFSLRDYNYVHPVKVAILSMHMGKKMGYGKERVKQLGMAALFQNIGYVLLPQGILEKSGFLNNAEMQAVQKHSQYGSEILARYLDAAPETCNIVLQHHEKWDGSGYPAGLRKYEINQSAQIVAIMDICFALASKRPHREEFLPSFAIENSIVSPQDAIEYIIAYSGELFDPEVVRVFSGLIPVYPTGTMVKLNDGRNGIISMNNPGCLHRPKIRIVNDVHGEMEEIPDICTGCEIECSERHVRKEEQIEIDLAMTGKRNILISELSEY